MQKLDSYMASLGVNLGRTSPGMSGAALAVMAGRIVGRAAGQAGAGTADGSATKTKIEGLFFSLLALKA